jgi:hypothetical protein
MHVLTLRARVWGGRPLVLTALAAAAGWAALPAAPVPVPGRDGVSSVVWPLLPVLTAAVVPAAAEPLHRALERTSCGCVSWRSRRWSHCWPACPPPACR